MMDKLVVVGLDGLDVQKAQDWQPELLLSEHSELDLSAFAELKTSIIWPTMYAGETPYERGFSEPDRNPSERAKWANPAVDVLSYAGSKVLPRDVRRKVGHYLKESSAESLDVATDKPQRELFADDSVFSALKSRVVEVPAWNKGEMDIAFNETRAWRTVLDKDDGVKRMLDALSEEYRVKTDETVAALDQPYDLVWTHFHFIDAVSHFFDREIQQEWYNTALDAINEIRAATDEDTELVIAADHGLGKYDHRPPGLFCVDNPELTPLPERPREVRDWIESKLSHKIGANEETMQRLKELGYNV